MSERTQVGMPPRKHLSEAAKKELPRLSDESMNSARKIRGNSLQSFASLRIREVYRNRKARQRSR